METVNEQLYLELSVPPNGSSLNTYDEEFYNTSELVGRKCEDGCMVFIQAEKRVQLTSASTTDFIVVLLSRATGEVNDHYVNTNEVIL